MDSPFLTLAESLESLASLLEARGEYTYEEIEEKRWILGSSGNTCDDCEEAADRGWVDMDDGYDGPMGIVDEPPMHPHCDCTIENRTRRKRVKA